MVVLTQANGSCLFFSLSHTVYRIKGNIFFLSLSIESKATHTNAFSKREKLTKSKHFYDLDLWYVYVDRLKDINVWHRACGLLDSVQNKSLFHVFSFVFVNCISFNHFYTGMARTSWRFFFHGEEEERTITYFKLSKLQGLWLAIGLVFGLHQGMTQQQQKTHKKHKEWIEYKGTDTEEKSIQMITTGTHRPNRTIPLCSLTLVLRARMHLKSYENNINSLSVSLLFLSSFCFIVLFWTKKISEIMKKNAHNKNGKEHKQ